MKFFMQVDTCFSVIAENSKFLFKLCSLIFLILGCSSLDFKVLFMPMFRQCLHKNHSIFSQKMFWSEINFSSSFSMIFGSSLMVLF